MSTSRVAAKSSWSPAQVLDDLTRQSAVALPMFEGLQAGQDMFYRIRFQDHSFPNALSEPQVGSDAANLTTRAVQRGDREQVLYRGLGYEVATLDPQLATGTAEQAIVSGLFEGLVSEDSHDLHPVPGVAARWTESPDHLTYTFKLRQGIHFHNGKLMTSADVVASFDRYAKVGNQRSTLDNVDRWDAPITREER